MTLPLPLRMILVLVLITSTSGFVLSMVWEKSEPLIIENARQNLVNAIFELNPGASSYDTVSRNGDTIYHCLDKSGKHISNFFVAQGNGFQGLVKIAVSAQPDWTQIIGIRILEQSETPGLGSKIMDPDFTGQYEGLNIGVNQFQITSLKNAGDKALGQVESITGATISSVAVQDIINSRMDMLRKAGY